MRDGRIVQGYRSACRTRSGRSISVCPEQLHQQRVLLYFSLALLHTALFLKRKEGMGLASCAGGGAARWVESID